MAKGNIDPCFEKLQEYYAQGRASRQSLGLRHITLDGRLQARDFGDRAFSEKHIADLKETMRMNGEGYDLAPIVVFSVLGVHYVVDGFHRWHVYSQLGRESIVAHVVEGTWSEAVEYAAMANQMNTALPRSREDVRKAIRILMSDDGFWLMGDKAIAARVRCSDTFVRSVRAELCEERGVHPPSIVVRSDGRSAPRIRAKPLDERRIFSAGAGKVRAKVLGTTVRGRDPAEVASRSQAILEANRTSLAVVSRFGDLVDFLARRNVVLRSISTGWRQSSATGCGIARGFVVGPCDLADANSYYRAIGRIKVAAAMAPPGLRCVLISPPDMGNKDMRRFAEENLGIEFMTPDEFVELVNSESPAEAECVVA